MYGQGGYDYCEYASDGCNAEQSQLVEDPNAWDDVRGRQSKKPSPTRVLSNLPNMIMGDCGNGFTPWMLQMQVSHVFGVEMMRRRPGGSLARATR